LEATLVHAKFNPNHKISVAIYPKHNNDSHIEKVTSLDTASTEIQTETKCWQIGEEIEMLKKKINKLDRFVEDNGELKQLCMHYAQNYESAYGAYKKPSTDHLNSESVYDRLIILSQEKNRLQRALHER